MGRGQVTLFIIVGTILLLIVVVVTMLMLSSQPQLPTIVQAGQTDLPPLEAFIERCLSATTQQGLVLAGMQGGFTELPARFAGNPDMHVATPRNNPIKIPMWSKGGYDYAPTVPEIEAQVASFVNERIVSCLQDFADFPELSIRNITSPQTAITFGEQGVTAELLYTLQLQGSSSAGSRERFAVRFPLNMLAVLDTAHAIKDTHSQDPFLAHTALDLMALDARNIPIANFGVDFACDQKLWYVLNIEDRLQELLSYNIPRIRIQGTNHRPFIEDPERYIPYTQITIDNYEDVPAGLRENYPEDIYEFNHLYWYAGADVSSEVNVGLRYFDEYPLYLDVRPQDDGILSSTSALGNAEFLKYLCLETYKFTYDVEFPVEFVVVTPDSFTNGESYVFRFALPVVIDDNIPTTEPLQQNFRNSFVSEQSFCNAQGDTPVNVIVIDDYTFEEVDGADIFYDCLGFTCRLGTTQRSDNGASATLQSAVPEGCFGPVISASGPTINDVRLQWNNDAPDIYLETQTIESYPLRMLLNRNGQAERTLEPPHEAFVTVQSASGHSASAVAQAGEYTTIDLLRKPQSYNISVLLFYDGQITGGYTGEIYADYDTIGRTLALHVWEDLTPPTSDEEIFGFFEEIQDPQTYEGFYTPEWR